MSAEPPHASSELTMCPSCGAAVDRAATTCWLCQWDLSDEIVTAEVVAGPPQAFDSSATKYALIAGIVMLGLAAVGVFAVAPGVGVLMGIVFAIAMFAVVKSLKAHDVTAVDTKTIEHAYASPVASAATTRGSVIGTVFMVLGIIGLIAIASVIAFFTFCVICVMSM